MTEMMLLRPVKSGNTFEQTVERLAQAIKLGVVPVGERLPAERELAAQLNVSRVTLRDAIRALTEAGYVESRRGRLGGTFVLFDPGAQRAGNARRVARRLGAPEVLDVLAYRAVVEPGAAELAAATELAPDDIARLKGFLDAVCEAATETHRIADSRLHLAIGELSGSPSLAAAVTDIQVRINELLLAIPVFERNIAHSDAQHRAIVKAIVAGDPAKARRAMTAHVEATAALLRGLLA